MKFHLCSILSMKHKLYSAEWEMFVKFIVPKENLNDREGQTDSTQKFIWTLKVTMLPYI